jgi:hypothetical protein
MNETSLRPTAAQPITNTPSVSTSETVSPTRGNQESFSNSHRLVPGEEGPPQPANQKRTEVPVPRRSGFGIFGKSKEEEDDREQLKRLKAENKRLRDELRTLEVKYGQLGAENDRYKSALVGDRKINNQVHPDSYYSSALERLWIGITNWTVTHFRGKSTREYTIEMVEEIRNGLKKLSDDNSLIPQTLHWADFDLRAALMDSKFRIAFVQHVISLHLHEKIFSPFSYEIEDFGLGYWLKRISDEITRSGRYVSMYGH